MKPEDAPSVIWPCRTCGQRNRINLVKLMVPGARPRCARCQTALTGPS